MYDDKVKLHKRQSQYKEGNLRTIALDVTSKCNMSCKHCYAETFRYVKPIELDILRKALNGAYDMGVFHYVLQGGEAIIDPDRLHPIIKMIRPDETYITIVSNGWAMTTDRIKQLKDMKVDKLAYSLDSGIELNHDDIRMPGSFQRVKEAVDNTLNEGLDTSVSCVITKGYTKTDDFKRLLDYVVDKQIRLDIQVAMPVGNWDGNLDCLASAEDIRCIKKLRKELPRIKNNREMIKRDIFTNDADHCPAVTEFLGLTVDGNLLPCNFMQFTMGNIRDHSIKEMRDKFLNNYWFTNEQRVCLLGENRKFIEEFVTPYVGEKKPLDATKLFLEGATD